MKITHTSRIRVYLLINLIKSKELGNAHVREKRAYEKRGIGDCRERERLNIIN